MYNVNAIKNGIAERKRIAKACRAIARQYAPVELPESVIYRIYSRNKLYFYLEALGLNETCIQAIFWSHDLAVPRNPRLRPAIIKEEKKPEWMNPQINFDPNDFF